MVKILSKAAEKTMDRIENGKANKLEKAYVDLAKKLAEKFPNAAIFINENMETIDIVFDIAFMALLLNLGYQFGKRAMLKDLNALCNGKMSYNMLPDGKGIQIITKHVTPKGINITRTITTNDTSNLLGLMNIANEALCNNGIKFKAI